MRSINLSQTGSGSHVNDAAVVEIGVEQGSRAVNDLYHHMDTRLGNGLPGSGEVGNRPDDVQRRLLKNARKLHDAGIDTHERLDQWLKDCWQHDATIASIVLGGANNLGYEVGMTAASEGWVGKLPPHILRSPATTGMIVGLAVGALDVVISVVGGEAGNARIYNGRCDDQMPASIQKTPQMRRMLKDTLTSVALNVAKNSFRMVAPAVHHATLRNAHGLIPRNTSDRIDIQMDGIGGFVSNAINQVTRLDPGHYSARLILRDDIDKVIDKSRDSWGKAALDALKGAGQGVKNLVTSPVPAAIVGTIGAFIASLFSANAAIDQHGNSAVEQAGNFTMPNDSMHYGVAVGKRADSMAQMGLMTLAIPLVAAVTDKAFNALTEYLSSCKPSGEERGVPTSTAFQNSPLGHPESRPLNASTTAPEETKL